MGFAHAIRFLVSEGDAVVAMDVAEILHGQFPDCVVEIVRAKSDLEVSQTRPERVSIVILSASHATQELCDRLSVARAGLVVLGDSPVKGQGVVILPKPFTEEMLVGAVEDSLAVI